MAPIANAVELIGIRDLISQHPATIKLEQVVYKAKSGVLESEFRIYQALDKFESAEEFDEVWNTLPSKLDFFSCMRPEDARKLAQSILDMLGDADE